MQTRYPLILIITGYLVVGGLFAAYTPDWEAPDEPAHYNYIAQLARGQLPVMESTDYDQDYIVSVVFESHFAPGTSIEPITYEDWQPPLYYLLLTPIYLLSNGSLLALRLASLLLGAGTIALAYLLVLRLLPNKQWAAASTAVFIAFLPQHLSVLASVNNDSLAELIIAAILYNLVSYGQLPAGENELQDHRRNLLFLGGLLGLGFLTKGTVYPIALVIGLGLLWRRWRSWRQLFSDGLWVFGAAAVLGLLWWGRNAAVYGGLDILGKAAHDAVVTGQPRSADLVASIGLSAAVKSFVRTTFNSFWGQFGWMTVPMPERVYQLLILFSGAAAVGLLLTARLRKSDRSRYSSAHFALLAATFLLTAAVHVGYNLTFQQHQGRYLFPALIPIGLAVSLGLGGWLQLLRRYLRLPMAVLPIGLGIFLILFDLWALFRVIVPALA